MKRKIGVVSALIFIASLFAITFAQNPALAEPISLTYANFPPAPTFPCVQMERWKKEVEKRTNGAVSVKTFPGGTLLDAKAIMDGVIAGTADIGNLCMAYQPGRFIITNAISLPVSFTNAATGSLALWELYNKYKPEAFSQVKVLTMFTCAPSNLMTKKPIRTLEDLKGVNLRASGGAASILKAWGANQIGMPQSEVPEAMQKGRIEGQFTSLEVLKDFKYAEMCKYVTILNGPVYAFAVVMNMDSWNKLPKDVQKVMDDMAKEQSEWTGRYMDNHVDESVEWSKQNYNLEVINLSESEKARWDKPIEGIISEWIQDAKGKGFPAEQIVEDIKTLASKTLK
ncbi:MAG TPA: TRAP transporter substrate-binding protein [Desulfatiglandales bacterium]|nr:TRAP transporter substrate-binding protein [Desulfatiglandales bacterium]